MSVAPVRIQLSRAKGFSLQERSRALNGLVAINVARPGPWGNPFVVGQDGDRPQCIRLFELLIAGYGAISVKTPIAAQKLFTRHAADHWSELKGKNLACWCGLDKACHGDVLLKLANMPICEGNNVRTTR